ncbi:MAG: arginine--tRNA ligase [Gammaproteobacteria bacterium]|jgi:arginyl-tRNA synthetase|nr:arginine--tRNA ligase [Gammaproteobacteria bacterium]
MLIKIIENKFSQAFQQAFPDLDKTTKIEVTRSTHARFGHYQCNSAMKLTKLLKMPPRDISLKVLETLGEQSEIIEKCEIAGPGFINISLTSKYITQSCQEMTKDIRGEAKADKPIKIAIDFSSPNTAKEMHVGHLRSTIIGDSLARLLEFQGHDVLRLNHIGDWGTAFGMLIAKLQDPKVKFDEKTADLSFLVTLYKEAKKQFDEDENFKKQSQLEVVKLQSGDAQTLQYWHTICQISRKAYQEIYDLLDINITERGESFYNPLLADTIKDLENKKLIEVSDGAKCMFLEGYVNREGEPLPFMLQKSDGGYNYATTDMASIRHRIEDEKCNRLIYVTDAGQATHFAMLFKAAEIAGYLDPQKVRADHVPFGLVLGPDGKKFKTRSGETEKLIDLLTTAIDKAYNILQERAKEKEAGFDPQEMKDIATVLGINAVKYSDLSCNRTHDYAFSYDKMLRFEGNTAAFLMYSYVRIHGIKRKIPNAQVSKIDLQHESEIALGLHICQFAEILDSISDDLMPNRLCEYLFELAEKFNGFFRDCRVEGVSEQNQRLALCELTADVLQQGLSILGLKTVTRM